MKHLFVLVLVVALCSFACAQNCDFDNCGDCFTGTGCVWCDSTTTCLYTNVSSKCPNDLITTKNRCPSDKSLDNIGTFYLKVFVPVYIVLSVVMIIVHYLRVHVIEPVIDFHANRRGFMDFSALLDSRIEEIINSALPPTEQLIWADVSLKISRWRHMLPAFASFLLGIVVLSLLSHIPAYAEYLLPLFAVLTLPCLYRIFVGLHQLIGKKHYTHVYLLTNNGAVIVQQKWRGSKVFQWPYKLMSNIRQVHVMYKVASVFFAPKWDITKATNNNKNRQKLSNVGFENIVNAGDVEDRLRQAISQLSPKSPPPRRSFPNI